MPMLKTFPQGKTPLHLQHIYLHLQVQITRQWNRIEKSLLLCSTRLESMILRHCVESVPDPLSIIATASRLIKLDISYNLRNAAFCDKSLSILKSCLTLRDLDVSFTKISAAGLVSLRGMTTLTRLAANSCDIDDAFVQQFSEAFPRLETLELSSSW